MKGQYPLSFTTHYFGSLFHKNLSFQPSFPSLISLGENIALFLLQALQANRVGGKGVFSMNFQQRQLIFQDLNNTARKIGKDSYTFLKCHSIILNMVLHNWEQLACGNSTGKIKKKQLKTM